VREEDDRLVVNFCNLSLNPVAAETTAGYSRGYFARMESLKFAFAMGW
jgi:hypothetical protein